MKNKKILASKLRSFNENCSNVILMVKYVIKCDNSFIALKITAMLLATIETCIGTVYIKWIMDFITDNLGNYQRENKNQYVLLVFLVQIVALLIYSLSLLLSKIIIPRREYVIKNKLQDMFVRQSMRQDLCKYEDFGFYDTYTKTVRYADTKALDVLNICFNILENIFKTIAILTIITQLDSVVLCIALVLVVISIIDQRLSNKYSYQQFEVEDSLNRESNYIKRVAHHRQFAKDVRIYQLSDFLLAKLNTVFLKKFQQFKKTNTKYWLHKYIVHLINSLFITPILLIYVGFLTIEEYISFGDFTVLFSSAFTVSSNLSAIFINIDKLEFESKFYVSKLRKMLTDANEIEDKDKGIDITEFNTLTFQNVYFKYPSHDKWTLSDVSFEINKLEHVSIVGKNGAGKSTIIKLIFRLYDTTKGQILINGVNIKKYNIYSLRKIFSVVLQDYQIFDFTIRDNLCFDKECLDEVVNNALSFAGISNRINELKNGILSFVGREFNPEGENFSGGELQKIAVARSYIQNGMCCIWDEANSSLDPFAEYSLNQKIKKQNADKTMIIVTHRLTTAVDSSRIIHIENGRIISIGNHTELYNTDVLYKQMFECQSNAYLAQKENEAYG